MRPNWVRILSFIDRREAELAKSLLLDNLIKSRLRKKTELMVEGEEVKDAVTLLVREEDFENAHDVFEMRGLI